MMSIFSEVKSDEQILVTMSVYSRLEGNVVDEAMR